FTVVPASNPIGTFSGPSTVVTDANGLATAPPFTTSSEFGTFVIQAQVNGLQPVTFNLTNSCVTVVTNNGDSGPGSLRDAVNGICTLGLIKFAPGVTGTITLTSGEIVGTDKEFTLQGPGADILAISGNHNSRIFAFNQSCVILGSPCVVFGNSDISISGLTLKDGSPSKNDTAGGGGAIFMEGTILTLTDSVIVNNDASNASSPSGGGIDATHFSQLNLSRTAIINNTTVQNGGGIHLSIESDATIDNSTIAGNTTGSAGQGGGIELDGFSIVQITNSTIFGNSANVGGNISRIDSDPVLRTDDGFNQITNNIISGGILLGSAPKSADMNNIQLIGQNGDFNLIQDATTVTLTNAPHNITGANPLLLQLGNHGGPSPTLLPLPNSPVIGAGTSAVAGNSDQRGFSRRQTGNSDIGAVETNYALAAAGGTPQSARVNSTFAAPLKAVVTESGISVQGVTVTFSSPNSGASALFGVSTTVSAVTDNNGLASVSGPMANAITGVYAITASVGGSVPTASFNLTNLPSVASVTPFSGTPQKTAPGAAFANPLQVVVRDADNNPVSGVTVTFTAPGTGASGLFFPGGVLSISSTSNIDGIAAVGAFIANNSTGSYTVTASVEGNVPPAVFNLSNVNPGPAASISAKFGTPQAAGLGKAFGAALVVNVTDSQTVPVQGATVTLTIVPNGDAGASFPGNVTTAQVITDINGLALAPTITANQFVGSYTVTATVPGVSSPAVFDLTNQVIISGDLTGDGQVTVQDLVVLANIIAGNISPTPTQLGAADVFDDHTGQITIQDLVTLANFIAGNIHSLPVTVGSSSNPDGTKPLADVVRAVSSVNIEAGFNPALSPRLAFAASLKIAKPR
ncbi:MAG TPA: choice-of-anchor Q domain-containing protein, partial [Blastocatellia bacterium]|nr:choice-of-anchor Q domain-containing protein [Blastocatellia bacterium]